MSDETPWNHSEDESLPWIKNEKNDDMVTDDDDDGGLAGSFSNVQIEAIFSRAQRFRRTAPVATTWDETSDSGSDAEVVGTIHPSDQPWFEALECACISGFCGSRTRTGYCLSPALPPKRYKHNPVVRAS